MRGLKSRLHLLNAAIDLPAEEAPIARHQGERHRKPRSMVKAPLAVPAEDKCDDGGGGTRQAVLARLRSSRSDLAQLRKELRSENIGTVEHRNLSYAVADAEAMKDALQERLDTCFVPQHSPAQLASPRDMLTSSLFGVRARGAPRSENLVLTLVANSMGTLRYRGPELRQVDGLVFMLLVNMLRDVKVGAQAAFAPADVCELLLGGYSGQAREQLRQIILRLQQGVLEFPKHAVQLAQRFEFPDEGPWRVALDPDIVQLFSWSRQTWLELKTSLALPVGLATWLYGYVESQTVLIPAQVEALRTQCGSEATAQAFEKQLRRALNELVAVNVLDAGWSVAGGTVRWMKARQ